MGNVLLTKLLVTGVYKQTVGEDSFFLCFPWANLTLWGVLDGWVKNCTQGKDLKWEQGFWLYVGHILQSQALSLAIQDIPMLLSHFSPATVSQDSKSSTRVCKLSQKYREKHFSWSLFKSLQKFLLYQHIRYHLSFMQPEYTSWCSRSCLGINWLE